MFLTPIDFKHWMALLKYFLKMFGRKGSFQSTAIDPKRIARWTCVGMERHHQL